MHNTLFVRGQSSSVKIFDRSRNGSQVIWIGDGKRFSWASRADTPSSLARPVLSCANYFQAPST